MRMNSFWQGVDAFIGSRVFFALIGTQAGYILAHGESSVYVWADLVMLVLVAGLFDQRRR